MKHLNLSAIALFVIVSFAACKKTNPKPAENINYPQVKSVSFNGTTVANFSYDQKGQLTVIDIPKSSSYPGYQKKFSYGTSGKLIKSVTWLDSTMFVYNVNGQLSKITSYKDWNFGIEPTETKTEYTYNNNGDITSISTINGTQSRGFTAPYTVICVYNIDAILTEFTYSDGENLQKFTIDGYNDKANINPIILDYLSGTSYYFGLAGITQLSAKFPKNIKSYYNGQLIEGYGCNFITSNNLINKIETSSIVNGATFNVSYELHY